MIQAPPNIVRWAEPCPVFVLLLGPPFRFIFLAIASFSRQSNCAF